MPVHESNIELECCNRAERHGWTQRKLKYQGRNGAPDRVFYGHGRVVFIEFKRPGGDRRALQVKEIRLMKEAGIEAHFCDSVSPFCEIMGIPHE